MLVPVIDVPPAAFLPYKGHLLVKMALLSYRLCVINA